jgi:hypothetical protein
VSSPAFERFRFSFFEDEDFFRNGLDTRALAALEGEEKNRAEDMLLRYLPDTRAAIGLGVLRSRRAEPELERLFEAEQGAGFDMKLIDLAKALWQIRPDPRWLEAVVEVLSSSGNEIHRQDAAQALAVFSDPDAVRALVNALDDPEELVRHHAARALLVLHGMLDLSKLPFDPQHPMYRVMSKDAVRREGGKADVLAAIGGQPIFAS